MSNMSAAPPPCGLAQEKVLSLASLGVPLVGGRCQNLRIDGSVCDCPIVAHPSELTPPAPAPTVAAPAPAPTAAAPGITLEDFKAALDERMRPIKLALDCVLESVFDPWEGIQSTATDLMVSESEQYSDLVCEFYQIKKRKYCMFLGDGITHCNIICAHLWPKFTAGLHQLTNLGLLPTDVSEPRNFLRLHSALEKAFDRKRFYFDVIAIDGGIRLVLRILDPSLKTESFSADEASIRFASLDGQYSHYLFLINKPFLRILAKHKEKALLTAKLLCWIPDDDDLISRKLRCVELARLSLGGESPILKAFF